ncbi:TVP38/TMEM64 family protein [Amaricoccus tamworthensis]|uniref:TVP38/TMEM64 family protein n=1 Tax=Amaricoccus tamworthensis TaxID=57002 RepID=UPI003C79BB01
MSIMTDTRTGFSPKRVIPILLIAAIAIGGGWYLRDFLNFETLRDNREALIAWRDANYLPAILAYTLAYVIVVAFSLPGALIMTLTGGFLFGTLIGGGLTVLAATIGATIIFLAARFGLGDALYAKLTAEGGKGTLARMERGLRENEVSYLFLMRLVPAIPFFVANLAPAFLGVKLRTYMITTFFGIIPGTMVYSWIGAGLGEVFARNETPNLGIIFEPMILGPILGLAALAAMPIVVKALRGKRSVK